MVFRDFSLFQSRESKPLPGKQFISTQDLLMFAPLSQKHVTFTISDAVLLLCLIATFRLCVLCDFCAYVQRVSQISDR